MTQLLLAPAQARRARNFAEQQPDSSHVLARSPDAKTDAEFAASGGRLTLDERISKVWEGLLATGTADCPVCRGRLERMGDSGRCLSCNSVLT
jgi:hypothetical protein